MGEVSGVVARRAKYPVRDNLSSAGDHEFRHKLTSGATEVIGEGQGESALEQEPGSVTEEVGFGVGLGMGAGGMGSGF
jgi:hypothetical protein